VQYLGGDMPIKIRVFISSTMDDLANERQAVVNEVEDLGLEAVNAESLLPNGSTSWNLLAAEIKESHIFILILGDRYGWIPTEGYGQNLNKSVTHLEFDLARSINIPVFAFFKKLGYKSGNKDDNVDLRDNFRSEVQDWVGGVFRAEFNLAIDLGQKVRSTLLSVFHDQFLKQRVRSIESRKLINTNKNHSVCIFSRDAFFYPDNSILFAGAGFSVAAGYPTASVLAEILGEKLGLELSGDQILSRYSFLDVATFAEEKLGRKGLIDTIDEFLDTAIAVFPTPAHINAVQIFPVIVTTNYDLLFERACDMLNIDYVVHTPSDYQEKTDARVNIYKIEGSIKSKDNLILTEKDSINSYKNNGFWRKIDSFLQEQGIVVVGHSIRDAASQKIIKNRNQELLGIYVSPYLNDLDKIFLHRFGLKEVQADADTYMVNVFGNRDLGNR
jgi:hypothetical protein